MKFIGKKLLPKKHCLLFTLTLSIALLLLILVFLCPISLQNENHQNRSNPYSETYVYPMKGASSFCVDENGIVYLIRKGYNLVQAYDPSGEMLQEYLMDADGISMVEFGQYKDIYDSHQAWSTSPNNDLVGLCRQNELLYCYRPSTSSLLCLDTTTRSNHVIWQANENIRREILTKIGTLDSPILTVKELAVSRNTAALLVMGNYDINDRPMPSDRDDKYIYLGERLILIDLYSGTWILTEYHNLTTIAPKGSEGFLVEGYDADIGHYFAELTPEGVLSEKIPTGINGTLIYAWDEENEMFHGGLSYVESSPYCVSGSLSSPHTAYRYFSNDIILDNGSARWSAGYLYLLDIRDQQILRLKPELFFQDSVPLKAYVLNLSELPDWQGYPVEVEILNSDELAIKILAGDYDFDFVIMNTDMPEAWNLKRIMAYVPLNDTIGPVIEGCFQGVQQAAMNGNDIWMLPLSLNMSALIYSEKNLNEAGISSSMAMNLDDWANIISVLYQQGFEELYSFPYMFARNHLLQSYLNQHLQAGKISFHTREFEDVLLILSSLEQNYAVQESYLLSFPYERYAYVFDYVLEKLKDSPDKFDIAAQTADKAFHQDVLVEWATRRSQYQNYQGLDGFYIRPIPDSTTNQNYYASADILIVNPNSRHLREALLLVEKMADSVVSEPNRCVSADRNIYPKDDFSMQLYECLSLSRIYQSSPPELYDYYYSEYLNNTLTHEELLNTLEQVLNAYYFE